MRKRFVAAILVGSLFYGGITVGAMEVKSSSQTKLIDAQWQSNGTNGDLSSKIRLKLDAITAEINKLKTRIQAVLDEVKPLQNSNKQILKQLKAAKDSKGIENVKALKQTLATNQQFINNKMTQVQPDLEKLKQLQEDFKTLKMQVKPIADQKKANNDKVKQLREKMNQAIQLAKQSKKQGNKEIAEAQLLEAYQLADQITLIKNEILAQKKQIAELLK